MASDLTNVDTGRGTMPVYVTRPGTPGTHPVVVLYMDAAGIRDDLHQAARRLADAGFTAVLPDLFYRLDPADRPNVELLPARDEAEFARMAAAVAQIADVDVVQDTRRMLMGGSDHVTPPSVIPPLREELERHRVAHRIDVFAGAGHASGDWRARA